MKKKYYWKVVEITHTPGIYASCYITRGDYHLLYHIGIPTQSVMKENGVFVFDTRKNARNFAAGLGCSGTKIFKCKVKGKEIKNPVYYDPIDLKNNKKVTGYCPFPSGTKSFPAITLIE